MVATLALVPARLQIPSLPTTVLPVVSA